MSLVVTEPEGACPGRGHLSGGDCTGTHAYRLRHTSEHPCLMVKACTYVTRGNNLRFSCDSALQYQGTVSQLQNLVLAQTRIMLHDIGPLQIGVVAL